MDPLAIMDGVGTSFVSSSVETNVPMGALNGARADQTIAAGEVVAAFGGRCASPEFLEFHVDDAGPATSRLPILQIEERLYLVGDSHDEPSNFINHSCDPTCGLSGASVLVALRDLEPGDPITYDYATSNGSDFDEFECQCGTALCRGKITGHDWMLPELQLRYRGNFSPYLSRRIAALHPIGAERRAFAF